MRGRAGVAILYSPLGLFGAIGFHVTMNASGRLFATAATIARRDERHRVVLERILRRLRGPGA